MHPGSMASQLPDFTGRSLNSGRYECTKVLGAGACGVVYHAYDLQAPTSSGSETPAQCAIKVVRKAGPTVTDSIHQHQEVMLQELVSDHPNVLTVQDTFEDSKFIYIVMDYCPGDLFRLCVNDAFLDKDKLVRKVFLQILDAVYACHMKKVFHRDLKPENILCSADGSEVYIADFGLATRHPLSNTWGCGSFQYMSPECLGEETGFKAYPTKQGDIWALGIILINMLTGGVPWQKAHSEDPDFADFLMDPYHFHKMVPISRAAGHLINNILALQPAERISIPELRLAILEIDTFFMGDDELVTAAMGAPPPEDAITAPEEGICVMQNGKCCDECAAATNTEAEDEVEDAHLEEVDITSLDPDEVYQESDTLFTFFDGSKSSLTSSSSSTSTSGIESVGPITPGSYSQGPTVEIPDFAESLGEALKSVVASEKKRPVHASSVLNLLERLEMRSLSL